MTNDRRHDIVSDKIKDLTQLRVMCLLGGLLSPVAAFMWANVQSMLAFNIAGGLAFLALFAAILALSYRNAFVMDNAYLILYIICFAASISMVYYYWLFKFTEVHVWLIILAIITTTLIVKQEQHLAVYLSSIFSLCAALLYFASGMALQRLETIIIILLFCLIAYIHIKIKLNSQRALEESEQHYRSLVEISPFAVIVHQGGNFTYANPTALKFINDADEKAIIGKPVRSFISNLCPEAEAEAEIAAAGSNPVIGERTVLIEDRRAVHVEAFSVSIMHKGKPAVMSIVRDITEKKNTDRKILEAEEKIREMAYHDALTGLPNRHSMNEFLEETLKLARLEGRSIGILYIDLDRFKTINDTLGHSFGDAILKQASVRLASCIRKGDMVCRHGGDEFVIILKDVDRQEIAQLAQGIVTAFNESFYLNDFEVYSTTSIGISFFPDDGSNVETLLKNADAAMYLAKEQGKNNFQFFSQSLNTLLSKRMELENGLRKALQNGEFILHYQPQIALGSGKITGLEALIRWQHPVLGMIQPSEFIPLAEETGIINAIGEWVLETACFKNKALQEDGLLKVPMSVNVSGYQLKHTDFAGTVSRILQKTGLEPCYLVVEITESIMQDLKLTDSIVNNMKAIGVKVAVDDFGTGYSSLNLLKNLTIDILKIDPSFIRDTTANPSALTLMKFIVDMGHELNYEIIAEGIETVMQAALLREINCDKGQGYYFNRPLDSDSLEVLFKNNSEA